MYALVCVVRLCSVRFVRCTSRFCSVALERARSLTGLPYRLLADAAAVANDFVFAFDSVLLLLLLLLLLPSCFLCCRCCHLCCFFAAAFAAAALLLPPLLPLFLLPTSELAPTTFGAASL